VLMPALRHIGILWQKNKISAADEHAATEICRYIIFRLCDSIPREKSLPYKALVSCVPGEEHEMGAEIMASYLESKGWRVYFVGHSAPEQDNIDAITKHKPDVVFLSVTLISNLPETVEFLKKIRTISSEVKIVLGGKAAVVVKRTVQKLSDAVLDDYQEVHSKALELLGKNA
jgi:methanogenic corrinoid protein MtbC1